MRRLLPLLLCLLPLSLFAVEKDFRNATPEELALTSVPFAPGAPAVILDWQILHDDENSADTEYLRMKILTPEGKKYGDIELTFVPWLVGIRDIKARTIRPDGTVVPFTGKMYDKLVIKAGGFKVMNKTFSLPEVQPGAILELRYRRTWPVDQLMPDRWMLQRELPILRGQIEVRPYGRGVSSFFTHRGLPEGSKVEKVKDLYVLAFKDMPAFEEEAFAPPAGETKPMLNFHYTYGSVDTEEYWKEYGKNSAETVESFIGNHRNVKTVAQQLVAGAETSEAKLRKLYERVQQIRNLSFEEEKSEQELKREKVRDSQNIDHVLREGYGYRGELNRLFVGLARAAGFEASIVDVPQRDELFFTKSLPEGRQLTGEVALVVVDGEQRFFDPGTPYAPYGMLAWQNTDVEALRLEKKGASSWIRTPKAEPSVTKRSATLELVDGTLKGNVVMTWHGQGALSRRLEAHTHDEATNRKSIEDEVKGLFPEGATVKLTKLSNLTGSDAPLVAELDVELPNLGTFTGSRALVPMSVFASNSKNPFASEKRKHNVYFSYPYFTDDEVTLKLPAGFALEALPQPQKVDLGAVQFDAQWQQDGANVKLARSVKVKTVTVPLANYKAIRGFYSRIASADQESVVLKKGAK